MAAGWQNYGNQNQGPPRGRPKTCFNCKGAHRVADCPHPYTKEYLEMREKWLKKRAEKNNKRGNDSRSGQTPAGGGRPRGNAAELSTDDLEELKELLDSFRKA
uniref:CCHC-type domain-containing protein n=1 Tax=Fibrocapsa japonica TaxID=94617 RepID=A0A7S2XUV9_9STRA|mmetsp:Transcript_10944/g.16118  ORF Transcript_10944/g.16118 Transcript_10944/m.16118 type:complete len:103 (+) Transcript_10944:34-342(+)